MQHIGRNTRLIFHVPGYADTGATVLQVWEKGRRWFLALDEPRPIRCGNEIGLGNRVWVPFDALVPASTDPESAPATGTGTQRAIVEPGSDRHPGADCA